MLQRRQPPKDRRRLQPISIGDGRISRHELARLDGIGNAGLRRRDGALADRNVSGDADLSCQHDVVFERRAAGDADLTSHQRTSADGDAMRDLDEVVDLRAGANPRFTDGRPIDGRVRPNLHVVFDNDVGMLRDFQMRPVSLLHESETVAADDRAVLHDHAMADLHAFAHRHVRMNHTVVANPDIGADHDIGINGRARADACGDKRTNRHVGAERRIGRDRAQPIDPLRWRHHVRQKRHRLGEGSIWVVGAKDCGGGRCGARLSAAQNDR